MVEAISQEKDSSYSVAILAPILLRLPYVYRPELPRRRLAVLPSLTSGVGRLLHDGAARREAAIDPASGRSWR